MFQLNELSGPLLEAINIKSAVKVPKGTPKLSMEWMSFSEKKSSVDSLANLVKQHNKVMMSMSFGQIHSRS